MHDYFDLSVSIPVLLVRLGSSLALGALVAWRPLSRRPVRPEVCHALLLMTVAAGMVVVVIGDSMARAFGVVGLGSFIRFRSAIKDPRDVVLFFLAIGTGMACGLGAVPVAAVGVTVVWATLVLLDRVSPEEPAVRPEILPEAPPHPLPRPRSVVVIRR